ncbi:MAG: MarR family transcriptional regulator [Dehalococcoidia bacterium]|nr:MarR family transcriptional regulator [Dehalococcoidia bacterium]
MIEAAQNGKVIRNNQERLNMTVNFESGNLILRLWLLNHQTRTLLKTCEEQIYGEYNLTTEQYAVLAAIKHIGSRVRPTDVARWMGRSPNSVSMIIDRMVTAGMVNRVRDRADRRVVRIVLTSKGENALKPATRAGWEFIQKIMSPLSDEDRHTFVRLHETLEYEIFKYLNPGENVEEIVRNETERHANLMERLFQDVLSSTPQAKRQGGKKGKTIR